MLSKLRFDIDNENFSHYFAKESALMSERQRESLPKELYFKLFKRGGTFDTTSTNKLSFLAKIFILIKSLRKRVIIIVEDEKGMDVEEFFKYKELLKKREYTISSSEETIEDAIFVLANKEIIDTYSLLNGLSVSPAYTYLTKAKNVPKNKVSEYKIQIEYICKWLVNYESNRKKIAMNYGLNMSEWFVLIALYDGKETLGSSLYNQTFRYTFNSSKTKVKVAFGTLQSKQYIQKIGISRGARMKITALGIDKVNSILEKTCLF